MYIAARRYVAPGPGVVELPDHVLLPAATLVVVVNVLLSLLGQLLTLHLLLLTLHLLVLLGGLLPGRCLLPVLDALVHVADGLELLVVIIQLPDLPVEVAAHPRVLPGQRLVVCLLAGNGVHLLLPGRTPAVGKRMGAF
jgi:hypothetical protein